MEHRDKILDDIMISNGDLIKQSTLFTKQCMIAYAEHVLASRDSRILSAVPSELPEHEILGKVVSITLNYEKNTLSASDGIIKKGIKMSIKEAIEYLQHGIAG